RRVLFRSHTSQHTQHAAEQETRDVINRNKVSVLPSPGRELFLRNCRAEACGYPALKHGQCRSESSKQNQVNHYAVEDVIPGFFKNTLGSKGTRDKAGTGLLSDKTRNDREKENQQSGNVEGH